MKIVLGMLLVLVSSGCAYYTTPEATPSRAEVEATNARTQCRALAKNLVQMARCDGR